MEFFCVFKIMEIDFFRVFSLLQTEFHLLMDYSLASVSESLGYSCGPTLVVLSCQNFLFGVRPILRVWLSCEVYKNRKGRKKKDDGVN